MGHLVCEACGYVMEESRVHASVEFTQDSRLVGQMVRGGNAGGGIPLTSVSTAYAPLPKNRLIGGDKHARTKSELWGVMSGMAQRLRCGHVMESAKLHVARALKGNWCTGQWSRGVLAACLYIAARQDGLPVTLLEVADASNMLLYKLGRVYTRVVHELGVQLPDVDTRAMVVRMTNRLAPRLGFAALPAPRKDLIVSGAATIVSLAERDWLATGRNPAGVFAAALLLSLKAYEARLAVLKEVAAAAGVSDMVVRRRRAEMEKSLLRMSTKLPWSEQVTAKTLPRHLPFILKHSDVLAESLRPVARANISEDEGIAASDDVESSRVPPSFAASQHKYATQIDALRQAQQRLQLTLAGKRDKRTPLSEKDLQLERALLFGCEDAQRVGIRIASVIRALEHHGEEQVASDNPDLGPGDLSEAELSKYLRTPEEREVLRALLAIDTGDEDGSIKRQRVV